MAQTRSNMTGEQLTKLMDRKGLDKQDMAEVLNQALERNYNVESIRRWETGARPIPKVVAAFLEELALGDGFRPETPSDAPQAPQDGPSWAGDTEPGPGPSVAAQAPLGSGSAYARACEDMWEMIATGIGMIGAATGSQALMYDGQIILADKQALGSAWGKLAETNDTFRRMLVGMTEGGAWLQVAMVTGTTVSKCWQAHAQYAMHQANAAVAAAMPQEEPVAAGVNGYGPDTDGHAFGTPGLV